MVFFEEMSLKFLKLIAVQMYEPAASFALAMEAGLAFGAVLKPVKLKSGRAVGIYYIFVQNALAYEVFELAVHRGQAYGRSVLPEILAYIVCGYMNTGHSFKILGQYLFLSCFVLWP